LTISNLSQMTDPVAVHKDVTNGIGNTTDDWRIALGGLSQGLPGGGSFGFGSGIFPTQTSNGTITDCQVTANTPTANMGAQVNFGNYMIARSYRGVYLGAITSPVPITFATANASNPRIDYVVIRIRDGDVDTPAPTRTADIVILQGTPSSTPAEPTGLLTEGDFLLAAVTVRAATTQILTSDISGRRVYATARGGIYPATSIDTRQGGYPGQMRYNLTTLAYEGWEGTAQAWVPIVSLTGWSSFTPSLYYQPSGPGSAVDLTKICSLGSGAVTVARYQTVGKTLRLNYFFDWGNSPYNMGWGAVFTLLPAGAFAKQETHLHTWLYVATNTTRWVGDAVIFASGNLMYPQYPFSSSDCRLGYYQVASTSSQFTGTGIPYISGNYPQAGILSITGEMELL